MRLQRKLDGKPVKGTPRPKLEPVRMSSRITKYGTIRGGRCDKTHIARAAREKGAYAALDWMKELGILTSNNGWYRIHKKPMLPRFGTALYWEIFSFGGDHEIGFLRFMQEVVPIVVNNKMAFRWQTASRWAHDIASFEFGIASKTPLSIITPGEGITWGFSEPHRNDIYKEKAKDGVV